MSQNINNTIANTIFEKLHRAHVSVEGINFEMGEEQKRIEKLQDRKIAIEKEITDVEQFLDGAVPTWREKYADWMAGRNTR